MAFIFLQLISGNKKWVSIPTNPKNDLKKDINYVSKKQIVANSFSKIINQRRIVCR